MTQLVAATRVVHTDRSAFRFASIVGLLLTAVWQERVTEVG
jgi:hypothetical protein